MQIVHGAPRKPSTQGSVERSNFDCKKMLGSWTRDNKSTRWSFGLKFVQYQKNKSFHSGMKCTPFEATFGSTCRNGLENTLIPSDKWSTILTEEDLFKHVTPSASSSETASAIVQVESEVFEEEVVAEEEEDVAEEEEDVAEEEEVVAEEEEDVAEEVEDVAEEEEEEEEASVNKRKLPLVTWYFTAYLM